MKLHYQPYLKQNARELRKNQTKEEKTLWFHLRKKNILDYQFYRQRPIGHYIADFYCPKLKLIIEVDGSEHEYKFANDMVRQKYLERLGFYIFRVRNEQVRNNLRGVVKAVKMVAQSLENGKRPRDFND